MQEKIRKIQLKSGSSAQFPAAKLVFTRHIRRDIDWYVQLSWPLFSRFRMLNNPHNGDDDGDKPETLEGEKVTGDLSKK